MVEQPYTQNSATAGVRVDGEIDAGLRAYMIRVYNYMALGIALSAVITLALANAPGILSAVASMGFVFFIALIAVSWFGPRMVLSAKSEGMAHAFYWGYAALWGVAIAPMVVAYLSLAPGIVVQHDRTELWLIRTRSHGEGRLHSLSEPIELLELVPTRLSG